MVGRKGAGLQFGAALNTGPFFLALWQGVGTGGAY